MRFWVACIPARLLLAATLPTQLALVPAAYWTVARSQVGFFGGSWWQWARPHHAALFYWTALTGERWPLYASVVLGVINHTSHGQRSLGAR